MEKTSLTLELAGKPLILETGQLAKQATSAVLARLGDTMVLATVVAGREREDIDYFPLTVEYIERLYAGGRIKGSRWVKREGRPSDEAILTARLIDRSIRPLFPKEYKKEVQIVVTVLSVDGENEPDVLSIIAVSAALSISSIPWNGPVGAIRMGVVREKENGNIEFLVNPGGTTLSLSDLDLVVSQAHGKTIMLEAGASQIPEKIVIEAIEKALSVNKEIISLIEQFAQKAGLPKEGLTEDTKLKEMIGRIEKTYKEEVIALLAVASKREAGTGREAEDLVKKIYDEEKVAAADFEIDKKTIAKAIEFVFYKSIRGEIIKNGKRPDNRKADEIREIKAMVSVLPRTHGSAIFQRGTTQALTVATLGSPRLEQFIESAEGEETKRYMHHYSMPPYSIGETGRIGVPSRREIGHGALAERSLLPVIPVRDKFPYTIRVVSEILSSNGSTSMASTCGSTLALMDAGVPIEKPVSGIAMGMVSDGEKYVILSDILGLEDFSGDMDFKIAGTESGITGIQLDVKIPGLTIKQITETLEKAKTGRKFILEKMLQVLPLSRKEVSEFAPKIELLHILPEKIGELIGPGGKTIKNIIARTGAQVDVEDDGTVSISGTSEEAVSQAVAWVNGLVREVTAGEVFEGTVKRILPFGAFVEFLPGKEGMVHVSKMSSAGFVKNPGDVVSIGEKVKIKVVEIDDQGRVNLSMIFNDNQDANQKQQGPAKFETRVNKYNPGQATKPIEHPLSLQFKRERSSWRRGGSDNKSNLRQKPKFRKSHY